MNTIDKIKEQIHTDKIEFFGSDVILDKYDPQSTNHLTCAIIENYLYEKTSDFYEVSLESVYFRTQGGIYIELDELIETDEEISSFYYEIQTSDNFISILIDVDIPTFDEVENYEDYIKKLFKDISRKTFKIIENFDSEDYFDDLYVPHEGSSPRALLHNLDKAKDTFYEFLDEIK